MKPLRGIVSRGSEEVPGRGDLSLEKIKLMLFVLALIAMTIVSASAFEQSPGNPARGMIAHDDRDGDSKVSKNEFPGPDEHFTEIDLDGDGFISGWWSQVHSQGWSRGISPYAQAPLTRLSSTVVLDAALPGDNYMFYFAVDDNADGNPDTKWLDSVQVEVTVP